MHDDGDWDSEIGEGIVEAAIDSPAGWVSVVFLLIGMGFLAFHYWS